MLRSTRAALANLYYHIVLIPGLDARIVELAAGMAIALLQPKRKINIKDLTLPWRPLYDMLGRHLFPKSRATGLTGLANILMDLAGAAQRFFPPSESQAMLEEMIPLLDGANINSVIGVQAYLVHFLPLSKPQRWLPSMFKLWESFESGLFDDQMLDLLARLTVLHANPEVSQSEVERASSSAATTEGPSLSTPSTPSPCPTPSSQGMWRDVGLLTKDQFSLVMTKALRSAGLPVGATKDANAALMAQSASMRTGSDAGASSTILAMAKPSSRISSFATIVAYSMMKDTAERHDDEVNGQVNDRASASSESESCLAGSYALDAVSRFLQATETYFHPSNVGPWQYILTTWVAELSAMVLNRWEEEQRSDCKTPVQRRITPQIKRHFVKATRSVCLLSMFSKDILSLLSCQKALKRLAILEPDLVLPVALERAYPGLEELETTHRTTAIITSLSTLAFPLVSRKNYPAGGQHLLPLLQLCLPAIDPTDFAKTITGCVFIINATLTIRLDDFTRPELIGDDQASDEDPNEEHHQALCMSTAGAEEWVIEFFRKVFAVFASLPEEGARGKVGGKQEDSVTGSLISSVDAVVNSLSPYLVTQAWQIVHRHCSETVSASSGRLVGSIVASFSRINPEMVLAAMVPMADQRLRSELEHGASSSRTTSTYVASPSDATFHWHLSCLIGAVTTSGPALLQYKEKLLSLVQYLAERTRSERGYSLVSRLIQRLITSLVAISPSEYRPFNPDEWNDPKIEREGYLQWGKLYEAKDVKISWHLPSEAEIDVVLQIVQRIARPAMQALEEMQSVAQDRRDKVWSNDFCRRMTILRQCFTAMTSLVQDEGTEGDAEPASDAGDECAAFIQPPPRFKSGFVLQDTGSPQYAAVVDFRRELGRLLYRCATSSKASEAEDKQDCIKLLLRTIRTYYTDYAYDSEEYHSHSRSLSYYRQVFTTHVRQKEQPRVLWLRRAAFYNGSRGRMNAFHRRRNQLYDALLKDVVLEYCMSTYVSLRKTAQNTLEQMSSLHDGSRRICIPRLLSVVKPGSPDDQVKGALYVLGSKGFSSAAITDARFTASYVLCLLQAQHLTKPSLQKLIRTLLHDFCVRFVEPSTLKFQLSSGEGLSRAVTALRESLDSSLQSPPEVLDEVRQRRQARIMRIDEVHAQLIPEVLRIGADAGTHWSFALYAARLVRVMIRRDQPLSIPVAEYFVGALTADNPVMRKYATGAVTKLLFFAKLRSLAESDHNLVIGKTTNPLKSEEVVDTPVTPEKEQALFDGFLQHVSLSGDSVLQDKGSLGWLSWGGKQTSYRLAPIEEAAWQWEQASLPALEAIWNHIGIVEWWQKYLALLSQEKARDFPAQENMVLIKSMAQVYRLRLVALIAPTVEYYIGERDRHKHRAAAEALVGLIRGSKHWPQAESAKLWEWFTPLLPRIFKEATQDSQPVWEELLTHTMDGRDPRRLLPLLDFVCSKLKSNLEAGEDQVEDSLQMQTRSHAFFRCALIALDRKLVSRGAEFSRAYSKSFDISFSEIRAFLSDNLANLQLFAVAPSYASVGHFLDAAQTSSSTKEAGRQISKKDVYSDQFQEIQRDLTKWKPERVPASQGSSKYDSAAMTALLWISTTLGDHRRSDIGFFAIEFLPSIFEMLELKDDVQLSNLARAALTRISTYHYGPGPLPAKLVQTLLSVMEQSKDSWRIRLDALPILQVAYFQNLFYLSEADVRHIVSVLLSLLKDSRPEVREMAATTLSGVVRCSERKLIAELKEQFIRTVASSTPLPRRGEAGFQDKLATLHSGILGAVALLTAFPYDVPDWMGPLLIETVCQHTESPPPVSETVKRCAKEWRRTHQDNWQEVTTKLTSDELQEVQMWVLGRSDYYA